ncbi:ThuA domain-containing protein [Chitinophaga sp. Cy-1792]|uniref:ThuA domain-containing protein n=1 Tax=Chitinophaga sp. Cy-1792 TaxID=2608339 RepID=UPI001F04A97C|nr:ThuA domain-containing protein [Chitinophaga sp. Cy-1792]
MHTVVKDMCTVGLSLTATYPIGFRKVICVRLLLHLYFISPETHIYGNCCASLPKNLLFLSPMKKLLFPLLLLLSSWAGAQSQFHVIAFYTGEADQAHISYVHEANKWFAEQAKANNFEYRATRDWSLLNTDSLKSYEVVLFLDTRPEKPEQRAAFQSYMENGGAWMGFHFAAFALTPSAVPANWDWYHNTFLGSGSYVSNTWRPTSAVLRVEDPKHPAVKGLPHTFKSSPNEWYRWSQDLTKNPDIDILLAIDSTSFPLGTGPKQYEIWHSGYYPVVWTNRKFRMVYMNMGHNDIDYENHTNKELSFTFDNPTQGKLVLQALLWLGRGKKK